MKQKEPIHLCKLESQSSDNPNDETVIICSECSQLFFKFMTLQKENESKSK